MRERLARRAWVLWQRLSLFASIVFRRWDGVLLTPRMAWEIAWIVWPRDE